MPQGGLDTQWPQGYQPPQFSVQALKVATGLGAEVGGALTSGRHARRLTDSWQARAHLLFIETFIKLHIFSPTPERRGLSSS